MNKIRNKEKRKFFRLRAYHLMRYKILKDGCPTVFVPASVKDIGGGGIRFLVEERIPLNTLVELRINFPSLSTPIFTLAKIAWSKQVAKSQRYLLGAQFMQIDPLVQLCIEHKVVSVRRRVRE